MAVAPVDDPVLRRSRDAVERRYGEQIERVVLFGSRARGDARPDSDYDIAVFLKDLNSVGDAAKTLAAIETDILMATGALINALPLRAGSQADRTGLMLEMRRDGRDF